MSRHRRQQKKRARRELDRAAAAYLAFMTAVLGRRSGLCHRRMVRP